MTAPTAAARKLRWRRYAGYPGNGHLDLYRGPVVVAMVDCGPNPLCRPPWYGWVAMICGGSNSKQFFGRQADAKSWVEGMVG